MIFADPAVAAVMADYAARADADMARMRELGPAGYALRDEFLLPVGAEVGAFLHALVMGRRPARILELGTSYGYSTLYLADAARAVGAQVVTMELADYKQAHARAALTRAGVADVVDWRCGDAVAMIAADDGPFDLVLLDIWKELYLPCFQAFAPKLSEEAVVVADNMIHPAIDRDHARAYRAAVAASGAFTSTLLPIGQGIEVSVKWSAGNPAL
ncbi:methyltransferase domain-containing protein [Novosphingobium sp. FSY-8]|uniref:Methyltransferase domain-containing protein n=1 Tax=Novosphingobium ovatum TaxID=1908523 RepID=A0ABW9X8Y0_9SPHN|nr:class I SAM-dependent methyltransferase [Novosphingobium ovatum]NBC34987.1 methyltransferase domain-containing protein [Novosphingobium ovatum]